MPPNDETSARPLGYGELLWWRISEAASSNAILLAQLDGHVDVERLRDAIEHVARLHPLLGAAVDASGKRPLFRFAAAGHVPMRIVARASETHYRQIAEQELNDAVPHDAVPLWRVALLHDRRRSELLLVFNHAITDGQSAITVMGDILRRYAGTSNDLEPMPPPTPYDDLIGALGPRAMLARAVSMLGSLRPRASLARIPRAAHADANAPPSTRILEASLDERTSTRLAKRCKEEGVTMHGLLAAVYLLGAAAAMDGGDARRVALTTAINVRPLLSGGDPRDVGYYVTGTEAVYGLSADVDPWSLARQVGEKTKETFTREHVAFSLLLRRVVLAVKRTGRDLVKAAPKSSRASIHLTNLGRLSLEREHGDLFVRRCFHIASVHATQKPFICLSSISFAGSLQLTFSYCHPITDRALVEGIVDRCVVQLRRIADAAGHGAGPRARLAALDPDSARRPAAEAAPARGSSRGRPLGSRKRPRAPRR